MAALKEDDISDVVDELYEARSKCYNLGMALIKPSDVEAINTECKESEEKLTKIILKWLRKGNDCTWETLCKALERPAVDMEQLAKTIREKFCKKEETRDIPCGKHSVLINR